MLLVPVKLSDGSSGPKEVSPPPQDKPPVTAGKLRTSNTVERRTTTANTNKMRGGGIIMMQDESSSQLYTHKSIEKSAEVRKIIMESIRRNVLFKGCSVEELDAMVDAFEPDNFPPNAVVITQGDAGDHFYVVEGGALEVFVTTDDGCTEADTPLTTGSSFGELALMHDAPRAATIKSRTACALWSIDRRTCRSVKRHLREADLLSMERTLQLVSVGSRPLTEILTPPHVAQLAMLMQRETFEEGDVIIREGGNGDGFYTIESGTADVFKADAGPAPLARYGPSDYFGERSLFSEVKRAATVTATSDVCCLFVSREDVMRVFGGLEDNAKQYLLGMGKYDEPGPADAAAHRQRGLVRQRRLKTTDSQSSLERETVAVDWKLADLEMRATLGMGEFGRVRLVKMRATGENYALKCISKAKVVKMNLQEAIAREQQCLALIDHPFVVKSSGCIQDSKYLYLRTELLLGGEFFSVLQREVRLPEKAARFYAASILLAFEHIHSKNIAYRDLKSENIVLDGRGYVKLIDFGFAKWVAGKTWTCCGTPDYMAPELVLNEGHNKGVDYWALGVLIYETVSGDMPFTGESQMALYQQITKNNYKRDSQYFKRPLGDLIKQLLQNDQNRRLGTTFGGAKTIMQHHWFQGFDWDGLSKMKIKMPVEPKLEDADDTSHFDTYNEDDSDVLDCPEWQPYFAAIENRADDVSRSQQKVTGGGAAKLISNKKKVDKNEVIAMKDEKDLTPRDQRSNQRFRKMTTAPLYMKDKRNLRIRLKSTLGWLTHQNNRSNLDSRVNSYGFGKAMVVCPEVNSDLEPVNILCMDGGGMKGFALITMLDELSKLCGGREFTEMFDLFGGTSVGGIAALQMGHRKTFKEGLAEALVWSDKMRKHSFGQKHYMKLLTKGSLFDDKREEIFKEMFGSRSTYLDHDQHGGLRSFAVCVRRELLEEGSSNQNKLEPFLLRTYDLSGVSQDKSPIPGTHKLPLYISMMATSAAPGAFERTLAKIKGKNYSLCDGMLLQNSPVIIAVREAKLLWPNRSIGTIVSLGLSGDEEESIEDAMEMATNLNPKMKYFRLMPPIVGMSPTEVDLAVLKEYQCITKNFMTSSAVVKEACESIMQRKPVSEA